MGKLLNIKVEKSELARKLERERSLNFDLWQHHPFDAGYDVRACIETGMYLPKDNRVIIPTGLYIEMDSPFWEIQVRPRSGLAAKKGITIVNTPGTVDFSYRDEIKVILHNSGEEGFSINPGDRIAQLCFREVPEVYIEYVDEIAKTVVIHKDREWTREERGPKNGKSWGYEATGELTEEQKIIKRGGFGSSGVE